MSLRTRAVELFVLNERMVGNLTDGKLECNSSNASYVEMEQLTDNKPILTSGIGEVVQGYLIIFMFIGSV